MRKRKPLFCWPLLAVLGMVAMLAAIVLLNQDAQSVTQRKEALAATTPVPSMAPPPLYYRPQALLLRNGSIGPEVIKLQTRLSELGYYSGQIDGKYYGGTASAVQTFQAQNGLEADGMAGEKTLAVLYGENAKPFVAPSPSSEASPTPRDDGAYTSPAPTGSGN